MAGLGCVISWFKVYPYSVKKNERMQLAKINSHTRKKIYIKKGALA
jgi:hypothetical protein